jgi:NAD(P)-dependent dehydrogenase (short-subunit alcohol dehydrogenase family)
MTTAPDQGPIDQLRFDDRVAIVTGAGGGLGRAHAMLLAARGAAVVVNDTGASVNGEGVDPAAAEGVAAEIRAAGGIAVADHNSVASPQGGAAIVAHALEEFGRLDIVVCNAGILRDKTLHSMTPEMFDAVIGVHLTGAFNVIQPAYVHMREQGYGRIVTTSSSSGLYGNFGQANYSAAKMGLVGLAKTIAVEGARKNVKANALAPTALTRMTEGLMGPLGQHMDPALVSPVVAWLCHESCPVSGEVFAAGAGRVARVVVGEGPGFISRTLTPEDVVAHLDQIMDTSQLTFPADVPGASALIGQSIASLG